MERLAAREEDPDNQGSLRAILKEPDPSRRNFVDDDARTRRAFLEDALAVVAQQHDARVVTLAAFREAVVRPIVEALKEEASEADEESWETHAKTLVDLVIKEKWP